MFQVERFSNTSGRISGAGTFDFMASDLIALGNATTIGPSGVEGFSGTMSAGDAQLIFTATQDSSLNFILGFNQNIEQGSMPTGAIFTNLRSVFWQPISTTGDVFDQRSGTTLGRYEIIAPVPLPAAGLMLGGSCLVLTVFRRRRVGFRIR